MTRPVLYGVPGSGAMICEAGFALAEIEIDCRDLTWDDVGWGRKPLQSLNPLGQIPTLVLPSGEILTESSAILHWIHSQNPSVGLIRSPDQSYYVKFLRWFMFLNGAVYPTFTYGDKPMRWVDQDQKAAELLRAGTDKHRKMLYEYLEPEATTPFFLGNEVCAIDLYLWMMSYWRPGKDWFKSHCPSIFSIAEKVESMPIVSQVESRNFPSAD